MSDQDNTPKTTRKGRTLRKENAATATTTATAENTVSAPVETAPPAPAATTTPTGTNIVLLDSRITQATDGWGKQEKSDARAVVMFALENMVKAAESKMAVGERFNLFAEKHGDKVQVLIKETAKLGIAGLTESNIALWRIRARELPKYLPNAHVRRFVLAMTGGEGLIIRDESYNEKDSEGKPKPKPYILSPFWQQSIAALGPVPEESKAPNAEEIGELYARKVASQASFLRTKARNTPEDARIKKQFATFQKRTIGWLGKHESLIWELMSKLTTALAKETTDLEQFEAHCGTLDKVLNGVTETRNAESNGKTRAKVA